MDVMPRMLKSIEFHNFCPRRPMRGKTKVDGTLIIICFAIIVLNQFYETLNSDRLKFGLNNMNFNPGFGSFL